MDRFTGVVQRILGSSLPRYELPINQQFLAELHGKRAPTSKLLRQQVADTLAFLGADEDAAPAVSSLVNRAVRDLLQQANRQPTVWLSLAYLLPQLAEASPDAFLEGVAAGLKGDLPPILLLFEERPDLFSKTAHHPGLLWALELLAWSPAYLGYAARLLAILTQLDPGSTLTNRPKRSLTAVFLPLLPQTRATASERFAVLDGLRHTHPIAAWSLLLSLLSNRTTRVGARTPRWQEWGPVERFKTVIPTQVVADLKAIAERVVQDVGVDPDRWIKLLPDLSNLDVDHLPTALQQLRQLTKTVLTEEQRGLLVQALRKLIHYRRSHERDDHNLSTDDVNELENSYQALLSDDYVQRYGWLFEFRPHLLSGNSDRKTGGENEYGETIAQRQREVLGILLASVGLSGVLALIARVEAPGKLGERLSERTDISSEQKDELLTRYLGSKEGAEWQFAHNFAIGYRLTQAAPWEWANAQVYRYKDVWTPLQQAAWLDTYPANPSTWQQAAELGADTEQQYWARISPYWVNVTDVPVAFANFLRYGRSLAAVQLAHLNQQVELPVDALTTALEAALYTNVADEPHVRMDVDDFAELLARLADTPDVEEVRIARLEFDLLPAQYERRLTAKSLYRALCASPAFFAQLVQLCSFSDDHSDPPSTDYERRANADKLLHGWPIVPGHNSADNTFDTKSLLEWAQSARQEVATISRTKRGEQLIGEMFSAAPIGDDGLWPHEAVRDAIEDAASDDMEFGFEVGTTNNHSFTVRGLYDGGTQEREMAAGFTSAAGGMALHWPRTAAVLRRLAAFYHHDASREDDEANLEHDLGL
ncbi:hypothetical protein [Hymenobacter terrenus]|uniref:hypothetical protein n=1 Tax=Hymenobacter terrenus TaxID=1629124 RepID=UPI0012E0A1AE|nr:hypothetical protein [Hymenobacter terrenus]